MNVKENMAAVWGEFVKRVLSKEIRQERTGRKGSRPVNRAKLLKHRKAERQARRYARMCAAGKKHRA